MPLSKKRNRERMRKVRATCVQPKSVHQKNIPVQPNQEVLKQLRELMQSKSSPDIQQRGATPLWPKYDPAIHKPGDTVLVQRGKRWLPYLIPELDGGGQPVPDYW